MKEFTKEISGCLWGCAIGDSLGLPFENLSPRRVARMSGLKQPCHRFFLNYGMVSDDTEHSLLVARSLLQQYPDPEAFQRALAKELRWWLAGLPAGIGFATLRSIVKLWFGVSPKRSGVFSAGNGTAMRSAIIGCLLSDDAGLRRSFTICSSELTHSDPKAGRGALAISELAARLASREWPVRPGVDEVKAVLLDISDDREWKALVETTCLCLEGTVSLSEFALQLSGNRGVSGYVYDTVPFAIACWFLHFDDFEETMKNCILGGGDTDTTGAICGALAGITCYPDKIPAQWRERIILWPLQRVEFETKSGSRPRFIFLIQSWTRNLFFFLVILGHLARRLLPPW